MANQYALTQRPQTQLTTQSNTHLVAQTERESDIVAMGREHVLQEEIQSLKAERAKELLIHANDSSIRHFAASRLASDGVERSVTKSGCSKAAQEDVALFVARRAGFVADALDVVDSGLGNALGGYAARPVDPPPPVPAPPLPAPQPVAPRTTGFAWLLGFR